MPEIDKLVTVTLDKERHLRLPLKGMLEFEQITGRSLLKSFNLKDLSLKDCAALIWACLLHEDKDLTYDDVLLMVDADNITVVMEAVTKCMSQSFPEPKAGDRPLAKKPRAG